MRTKIPIHADQELTVEWLAGYGYAIGRNCWYNAVRDASGRYDGFCIEISGQRIYVSSCADALAAMRGEPVSYKPVPLDSSGDSDAVLDEAFVKAVSDIIAAEDKEWQDRMLAELAIPVTTEVTSSSYDKETQTISMTIKISRKEV